MTRDRVLVLLGLLLIALAGVTLFAGALTRGPVVTLVLLMFGLVSTVIGAVKGRGAEPAETQTLLTVTGIGTATKIAMLALAGMGAVALIVAFTVAVGEAQGHAVGHWLFGAAALGLFIALAIPWHPLPGTTAWLARRVVLAILAVAAFGSFLESLGGAGYDAANEGRRVTALAALHPVALPIAALGLPAIPLGAIVGVAVFSTWAIRRRTALREGSSR